MRILFVHSLTIQRDDILWGIIELGIDVESSTTLVDLDAVEEDKVESLVTELAGYDLAFSQNFSATLAEACHIAGKPYLSWTYDSPLVALYRKEATYETSYPFHFDKKQCQRLKAAGVTNIRHMPLPANIRKYESYGFVPPSAYKFDISFIGQIYESEFYNLVKNGAPDFMVSHLEDILGKLICSYKEGSIFGTLYPNEVAALFEVINKKGFDDHLFDKAYMIENLLFANELSGRDRVAILNGADDLDVNLITHNPDRYKEVLKCKLHPPVCREDMYKIFASSKINLNITLRSIESGIPQRVIDIMTAGGFVLTNYQEEVSELFDEDKEIVTFSCLDEYRDKAHYYIAHEEERAAIAAAGLKKVREEYNITKLVEKMLTQVGLL